MVRIVKATFVMGALLSILVSEVRVTGTPVPAQQSLAQNLPPPAGVDGGCCMDTTETDPPILVAQTVSGNVDAACTYVMPFVAVVADCCVNADSVSVSASLLTNNATLSDVIIVSKTQDSES